MAKLCKDKLHEQETSRVCCHILSGNGKLSPAFEIFISPFSDSGLSQRDAMEGINFVAVLKIL